MRRERFRLAGGGYSPGAGARGQEMDLAGERDGVHRISVARRGWARAAPDQLIGPVVSLLNDAVGRSIKGHNPVSQSPSSLPSPNSRCPFRNKDLESSQG